MGLKPLPAGLLRDRLEAAARSLHFRYSDILIWNTRSTIANAMVTGMIPWIRYIIVSDRTFRGYGPKNFAEFSQEAGRLLTETRSNQPAVSDTEAIQKRHRRMQRLQQALTIAGHVQSRS